MTQPPQLPPLQIADRAFGTRLRRLLEGLNRGVGEAYRAAELDFEPRWFGLFTLVRDHPGVEVGEAAAVLGQSHPAVVQVVNSLVSRGYLDRRPSPTDRRRTGLWLTPAGLALNHRLTPVWTAVFQATDALLAEAAPDFLDQLQALEAALDARPMQARIQSLIPDSALSQPRDPS